MEKKLYTLIVHSENIAGILIQITAVFTRLQVNIESLNVSASSIKGIHKYTITAYSDEEQIYKISRLIEKKINGAFWDGYEAVIIDAPQLFESKMAYQCNFIVSVVAPRDIRIKRIMERDELTQEEAERRISSQLSDDFFRENSDVVIENDGDEQKLKEQALYVARLIEVKISGEATLDF